MNYYNIQYSPDKKHTSTQRIIYNKKIKIHGSRFIKNPNLNSNNAPYKQVNKNR